MTIPKKSEKNYFETQPTCPSCRTSIEMYRALYILSKFDGQSHSVRQCGACGLRFMDPMPNIEWLHKYYQQRTLYGADSLHAQDYENAIRDKVDLLKNLVLPHLKNQSVEDHLAVDFGAGSGYVVKAFIELGFKAFGIELNLSAPKRARELFNVELINGDLI